MILVLLKSTGQVFHSMGLGVDFSYVFLWLDRGYGSEGRVPERWSDMISSWCTGDGDLDHNQCSPLWSCSSYSRAWVAACLRGRRICTPSLAAALPQASLLLVPSLSRSACCGPWRRVRGGLWLPLHLQPLRLYTLTLAHTLPLQLFQVLAEFSLFTWWPWPLSSPPCSAGLTQYFPPLSPWKALSSLGFQAVWLHTTSDL